MKALGFEITLDEITMFFDTLLMKRVLVFVAGFSAVLLFLSDEWLRQLHLIAMRDACASVWGVVFICSCAMLIIRLVAEGYSLYKKYDYYHGKKAKGRIDKLSIMGRCTLYRAYLSQSHKVFLDTTDPLATELTEKNMLKPAKMGTVIRCGYYLPDWVVECLAKYFSDDIKSFEKVMQKEFKDRGLGSDALYD